ncbi:MAG TPA: hypothetical protein VLT87_01045 [Thermoanaerobaculia bacterium]|nr:hypothetical protein [Thermoanaerobaculia bacterium]HSN85725.1 hypothetical protein [Thermoanaerobaculia bacterium]
MSVNVGDFIGSWNVQWVSGRQPFLQEGWTIFIGTDTRGDHPPSLTGEYAVVVGFTVLNGQDQVELSTTPSNGEEPPHQPLELLLDGDTLRWAGYYEQQPLHIYISLSVAQTTGDPYLSLYGSTTWGDPDQVGVWGADARPPGG